MSGLPRLRLLCGTCVTLAIPLAGDPALAGTVVIPPPTPVGTTPPPEILLRGAWGSGLGEFGKRDEASRPGPMDFAVLGRDLYVLDPVNARVQVFDLAGAAVREIAIGTRTADFLGVDEDGRVAVLDAFVRRELATFDADGAARARLRLPERISLCSGLFAAEGLLWVEERHGAIHALVAEDETTAPDGNPVTPAVARVVRSRAGRPMADHGGTVQAGKRGTHEVEITLGRGENRAEATVLHFPRPIQAIIALETDLRGGTYVGVTCPRRTEAGAAGSDILLATITAQGGTGPTLQLPDAYVTDHYRKLVVTPEGAIIQMQTAEDEVRFVRWTAGGLEGDRP